MAENSEQGASLANPEQAPGHQLEKPDILDRILKFLQVITVVVGVVFSVLSFNDTRNKEAYARQKEAQERIDARKKEVEARIREDKKYADERRDASERQRIESAKPFLELRQKAYLEAVHAAAILSNPDSHSPEELTAAKKKFRELYVAELSMVEDPIVAHSMVTLAGNVDPSLQALTEKQLAAYNLAHSLRDSLIASWHVDPTVLQSPKDPSP